MKQNCMHVISPTIELDIPFYKDETVLAALERVINIQHPCNGRGVCGLCRFDIILENGCHSPQLACMYQAKEMTIYLKNISIKEVN